MPNTTGGRETLDGRGWVKVVPNRTRMEGSHTVVPAQAMMMCAMMRSCTCGAPQGQLIDCD